MYDSVLNFFPIILKNINLHKYLDT
jgi:hypothetical protein